MATVDQWFLPTNDGQFELYVRDEGVGRPVVVDHGGPGIEHSELVDPLSCLTASRRVIWYDQRGSIRSPYASQEQLESITYDAHVDDLVALLTEAGPADVVAHSMGTLVAMSAMARAPELMISVRLATADDRLSLHVIADCGHSPWYDKPKEFRAILEEALL